MVELLDIPGLPPGARYAHLIPGIKHSVRIILDRPVRVMLTPTNKAKILPPKPLNIKLDFRPPIRRN